MYAVVVIGSVCVWTCTPKKKRAEEKNMKCSTIVQQVCMLFGGEPKLRTKLGEGA